uniref:ABC1 atypical kinase-like domain-containing protein n=1 Tax=Eucampia antarctica TaxID=49252 RepID=A0A7S2WE07_9STRA|mmetsp:Transcript_27290/g.26155  ORF Transcript_27290/g.26155 Transcript_27290/m.26155 type:complete len:728 (+) Transcript_27290:131-2314(+)
MKLIFVPALLLATTASIDAYVMPTNKLTTRHLHLTARSLHQLSSSPKKKSSSLKAATMTEKEMLEEIEADATAVVEEMMEEDCMVTEDGEPADELCVDEDEQEKVKSIIQTTFEMVSDASTMSEDIMIENDDNEEIVVPEGELLEQGWEMRANSSAVRRNAEVWKFALKCVFKVLKPRKLRKNDASEEEIIAAKSEAANYIKNGLLTLGPSFVKLGQVISTRTDVLPVEYTEVLKSLQDDVPGFSGKRAKNIVTKELGVDCDTIFQDFSAEPLAAASLGQVHTAYYKGKKVAIKVQRAGLKELFDSDLKNLKKVAVLLDKFDPKTDGADRNWVAIYEESERLLYEEINYVNEAENARRFAADFKDISYVRVPDVYSDISTPRVLIMEFIESLKLTDIEQIDSLGLNRDLLAKRTANSFLRQIIETGYFHCDPHPGNLCVDRKGNLVYYDFGMMDELKPNVRSGFRTFCTSLFAGGPMIDDFDLAQNAKSLVDGVEEAGVLARGADRLAVEKLARFFMKTFKNKQLGKSGTNVKQTVGTDLQTLTENNVFRFPSTFTFIFRAFASIDGIGKGLDSNFDVGKLAQPFIETFIDSQKGYESPTRKNFNIFSKATGLNTDDINTAITSPRKIAYIEETVRAMEDGTLKVRVRSMENEKALERMTLTQDRMEKIMISSLLFSMAGLAPRLISGASALGGGFFALQAFLQSTKIKKFDKTQAKFVQTNFVDDE